MKNPKKLTHILFVAFLLISCSEKPEANFTWSPMEPKVGEEVQFTNQSKRAKKYSWNLGNLKISSEENPKNIYEREGSYTVDLSASKGLKSDMKTVTITVRP